MQGPLAAGKAPFEGRRWRGRVCDPGCDLHWPIPSYLSRPNRAWPEATTALQSQIACLGLWSRRALRRQKSQVRILPGAYRLPFARTGPPTRVQGSLNPRPRAPMTVGVTKPG